MTVQKRMTLLPKLACAAAATGILYLGVPSHGTEAAATTSAAAALGGNSPAGGLAGGVAGLRRLTEQQYRNTIADIFGADIKVNGRFEPIVRPAHELVALGASNAAISPAGLEQFDAMARAIAAQVFDERHFANFVDCGPRDKSQADDACAARTLLPLGRYLFRRPLSTNETRRYVKIARDGAAQAGTFNEGMQLALAAMLVSPDFLYIVESAEPDPAAGGTLRLDNYARAARLSFILWNTTPDEALLKAAEAGELTDDAKLRVIADRMVASPRLADGVKAFFSDMLIYEKFEDLAKDPIIYPKFNLVVAKELAEQMQRTIVDTVLTQNRDYRELFTTRRTSMTRNLGPLYGLRVDATPGWQPYEFPLDSNRAGLLSQAGFIALYSHPGRSSATLRGRAVRELLMCQPVPDPPGNVDFKVVQDTTNTVLPTARLRLSEHASNPVCAGCHRITDPIGLTLESFDGSGAFRTQENGADIDTSGMLDSKPFSGALGLGKELAANPATTECVAQRAMEYATGSKLADGGVNPLYKAFAAGGYRIRDLFRQMVTNPILYRLPVGPSLAKPSQTAMLDLRSGDGK
jgi:hypothetical protein